MPGYKTDTCAAAALTAAGLTSTTSDGRARANTTTATTLVGGKHVSFDERAWPLTCTFHCGKHLGTSEDNGGLALKAGRSPRKLRAGRSITPKP